MSGIIRVKSNITEDLKHIDDIGTDRNTTTIRAAGPWLEIPFKLYKEFVHAGGVKRPLIIHCQKALRIAARSGTSLWT